MSNYDTILKKFEKWLMPQACYTENTKTTYLRWVSYFLNYLLGNEICQLNSVDENTVEEFAYHRLNQEDYSTGYAEARIAALNLFFDWTYTVGLSRGNPVLTYRKANLKPQSLVRKKEAVKSDLEILTSTNIEQLQRLAYSHDFATKRDICIVLLILASGISAEETITLLPEHLNLKEGYLRITGKRARLILLDLSLCQKACYDYLHAVQETLIGDKHESLFFSNSRQPFSKRQLYRVVSTILQEADIITTHSGPDILRKTAIVHMFGQGKSFEEVRIATRLCLAVLERYQQIAAKVGFGASIFCTVNKEME